MAFLGFRKKKETAQAASACTCSAPAAGAEACACGEAGEVRSVKVLGAGCSGCHAMHEHAKEAAARMGLAAEVEYITDMQRVAAYGAMRMPALVVNEKIVSMGKVLTAAEIEALLRGGKA